MPRLFIEAAKLYRDISQNKTKSKLVELSEMHLLWFFQRVIRYCYNYDYLKPAINSVILEIDAKNIDFEDKVYALFFAACFAAQLGDPSGFEFLVKTYPTNKLPLQLSIAIELESRANKDFSKLPIIKAHEKRLRELLAVKSPANGGSINVRGGRSITEQRLTELFEKPVRLTQQRPIQS